MGRKKIPLRHEVSERRQYLHVPIVVVFVRGGGIIKIWQRIAGHEAEAKHDLYERLEEFKNRYISVGVQAEILDEQEIMKLCNLFGNSRQVSYENIESNLMYSNIPQIRG